MIRWIVGALSGLKGYAAAFAAGLLVAGVAQQWRLGGQIALIDRDVARTESTAVQRAAKGKSDAIETVSRLPDGGAAERLRDKWARD